MNSKNFNNVNACRTFKSVVPHHNYIYVHTYVRRWQMTYYIPNNIVLVRNRPKVIGFLFYIANFIIKIHDIHFRSQIFKNFRYSFGKVYHWNNPWKTLAVNKTSFQESLIIVVRQEASYTLFFSSLFYKYYFPITQAHYTK